MVRLVVHVLDLRSLVGQGSIEHVITRMQMRVTLSPCSELASHLFWEQANEVRFLAERRVRRYHVQFMALGPRLG